MKAFKYRWKIGNNEFIGKMDCQDESALQNRIKGINGELIEILEINEKEVGKRKTVPLINIKTC